jgi:hypothetical protein
MAPAATLAAADAARKAGNADEAVQICTQILAGSSGAWWRCTAAVL